MQTLRPVLRACQASPLRHATTLSRCRPCPLPATQLHRSHFRAQHDKYGPHKEYFQTPGQEPKPDLTPYIREPVQYAQPHQQASSQFGKGSSSEIQSPSGPDTQRPRGFRRLLQLIKGPLWFIVFLQVGYLTGVAFVTWDYLSPHFEHGSPEEQDLIEEILDTLDTHPLVEDLRRKEEWAEVDPFTPDIQHGLKGKHLLYQTLGGNTPQGVFMKMFRHQKEEYTIFVFFLGFGVEGWPDVIHGGLTSTILHEGLHNHVAHFYPGYTLRPNHAISIDFKKPCRPGDVYALLWTPAARQVSGSMTQLNTMGILVQLAGAPTVGTMFDVPSRSNIHNIDFPTQKEPIHATCHATVKLTMPKTEFNEGMFQLGRSDNQQFAKALDFLKKTPEFKGSTSSPAEEDKKKNEDED